MKNFLNDTDGISQKDYLLLFSTTIFFVFILIGLVLTLLGKEISNTYLHLVDMVAPVLMTITGGVFGVSAVQEFKKERRRDNTQTPTQEEIQQPPI